jgi:hypothetical protein
VFSRPVPARLSGATGGVAARPRPAGVLAWSRALRAPAGFSCVLALVLAAVLASCGTSDNGVASKPASEILAASTAAAKSASSVRVSSTTKTGPATSTFKLVLGTSSGRAAYSLLGQRFEVLRTGGALYLKGTRRFLERLGSKLGGAEGAAAAAKLSANTWIKVPAGSNSLAGLGELTSISAELPRILRPAPVVKGHETVVNGQKTITLKETTLRYTGTLYIATTGEPYPIQLLKHGRQTGKTTFTGWNDPINVSAPTNTVDVSTLEGKAH